MNTMTDWKSLTAEEQRFFETQAQLLISRRYIKNKNAKHFAKRLYETAHDAFPHNVYKDEL
mgnify:CR=1 FL=1